MTVDESEGRVLGRQRDGGIELADGRGHVFLPGVGDRSIQVQGGILGMQRKARLHQRERLVEPLRVVVDGAQVPRHPRKVGACREGRLVRRLGGSKVTRLLGEGA